MCARTASTTASGARARLETAGPEIQSRTFLTWRLWRHCPAIQSCAASVWLPSARAPRPWRGRACARASSSRPLAAVVGTQVCTNLAHGVRKRLRLVALVEEVQQAPQLRRVQAAIEHGRELLQHCMANGARSRRETLPKRLGPGQNVQVPPLGRACCTRPGRPNLQHPRARREVRRRSATRLEASRCLSGKSHRRLARLDERGLLPARMHT